jgi:hypothetical protein
VSRHWKPDGDIPGARPLESLAPAKKPWPAGATAGLVLVAAACLALGAVVYHVAGPRDVFEGDSPGE